MLGIVFQFQFKSRRIFIFVNEVNAKRKEIFMEYSKEVKEMCKVNSNIGDLQKKQKPCRQ